MNLYEVCSENEKYGSIFLEITNKFAEKYPYVQTIIDSDYTKVFDKSLGLTRYTNGITTDVLHAYKYDIDTIFYKKTLEDLKKIDYPINNYIPVADDVTEGVVTLDFPCVQLQESEEIYLKSLTRKNRSDLKRKLNAFFGNIGYELTEQCVTFYLDNVRKEDGFLSEDALHILYTYSRYLYNKDDVISCVLFNEDGTINTLSSFVKEEFGWHSVCSHGKNGTCALFYAMNRIRETYGDIKIYLDISFNLKQEYTNYFRLLCNTSIQVPCVFCSSDILNINVPNVYFSPFTKGFKKFSDLDTKFTQATIDECIEYNRNNPLLMLPIVFYKKYHPKATLLLLKDSNSRLNGIVYDFYDRNIINIPYTFNANGLVDDLAGALTYLGDSVIRHIKCTNEDSNKLIPVNIPSITLSNSMENYFSTLKSSRRNKIKKCLKSINDYTFTVNEHLNEEVLKYYTSTINKHSCPSFEYAVMSCAYAFDVISNNVISISIKNKEGKILGGDILVIDYDNKIVYCWAGHTDKEYNDLGTLLMYKDIEYIHSTGKFNGWQFEPTFFETMPWEGDFKCDPSDWYKLHFSNGMQTGYILNVAHEAQDYFTKPYYSCDKGWQID